MRRKNGVTYYQTGVAIVVAENATNDGENYLAPAMASERTAPWNRLSPPIGCATNRVMGMLLAFDRRESPMGTRLDMGSNPIISTIIRRSTSKKSS